MEMITTSSLLPSAGRFKKLFGLLVCRCVLALKCANPYSIFANGLAMAIISFLIVYLLNFL